MSKKKRVRTVQRERRILHGDYMTVYVFPVFQKAGVRRKKSKLTSEVQEKLNQKYREERLTQLINTNFHKNDLEIGLGYNDEHLPETYADVQKDVRNFIRRYNRYRQNLNLPKAKYIYTIEKGETNGRWHIHFLTDGDIQTEEKDENGNYYNVIEKIWGKGYAHNVRIDFDDEGFKGLAHYKVKEPETDISHVDGKVHRWAASKNLKKPTILKDRDGFIGRDTVKDIRNGDRTEREIERLYPGYTITTWEPKKNEINAGEYLIIRLRKTQASRITKQIIGGGKTNPHRRQ